jgi:hypothetical protein
MTLYCLVEIYRKFEENTSPLFRNVLEIEIIPPKYQKISARLHGVTCQTIVFLELISTTETIYYSSNKHVTYLRATRFWAIA